LAGPQGYQVWTSDTDGSNRVRLAAQPGHLYFGTSWSPDGRWGLYVDCLPGEDPGHDWADVCVGRADGSKHRVLTRGRSMWFAATFGDPKTRGGGSNVPAWSRDGSIVGVHDDRGAGLRAGGGRVGGPHGLAVGLAAPPAESCRQAASLAPCAAGRRDS
jgi:Tol biopolymer transport system component